MGVAVLIDRHGNRTEIEISGTPAYVMGKPSITEPTRPNAIRDCLVPSPIYTPGILYRLDAAKSDGGRAMVYVEEVEGS